MRNKLIILGFLANILDYSSGINCWKCISNDCEGNPEKNHKAEKVKCKENESCLKVIYQMHDNNTQIESVIRTCSSGQCSTTPMHKHEECMSNPHGYVVLGCSLRLCCNEDMCNSSPYHSVFHPVIWTTLLAVLMILKC